MTKIIINRFGLENVCRSNWQKKSNATRKHPYLHSKFAALNNQWCVGRQGGIEFIMRRRSEGSIMFQVVLMKASE